MGDPMLYSGGTYETFLRLAFSHICDNDHALISDYYTKTAVESLSLVFPVIESSKDTEFVFKISKNVFNEKKGGSFNDNFESAVKKTGSKDVFHDEFESEMRGFLDFQETLMARKFSVYTGTFHSISECIAPSYKLLANTDFLQIIKENPNKATSFPEFHGQVLELVNCVEKEDSDLKSCISNFATQCVAEVFEKSNVKFECPSDDLKLNPTDTFHKEDVLSILRL